MRWTPDVDSDGRAVLGVDPSATARIEDLIDEVEAELRDRDRENR